MKLILCFLFFCSPFFNAQGTERKVTIIHKQGQFDCHTFRIPAMATTDQGTLLAVYARLWFQQYGHMASQGLTNGWVRDLSLGIQFTNLPSS